jgi:hypothetical protein
MTACSTNRECELRPAELGFSIHEMQELCDTMAVFVVVVEQEKMITTLLG